MRFLLLLLLLGCSREKAADINDHRASELAAKKAFYCEQARSQYEQRKYMVARCDGLLFTSLWSVACGMGDIGEFQDPKTPGYWHRNPARDCYLVDATNPDNGAKSSISKDMLLGMMYYSWKLKKDDYIDSLIAYGEANSWLMGDAIDAKTRVSRTLFSPGLIDLVYDIQSRLGLQTASGDSADAFFVNKDFQAHLDVIRILLEGSVKGSISAVQAEILAAQAERNHANALFVAAAARYGKASSTEAINYLLDSPHFPNDRLPSQAEHCEPYLFQRDDGKDWQPCGTETHDGTDFVVAASILDGSL